MNDRDERINEIRTLAEIIGELELRIFRVSKGLLPLDSEAVSLLNPYLDLLSEARVGLCCALDEVRGQGPEAKNN